MAVRFVGDAPGTPTSQHPLSLGDSLLLLLLFLLIGSLYFIQLSVLLFMSKFRIKAILEMFVYSFLAIFVRQGYHTSCLHDLFIVS